MLLSFESFVRPKTSNRFLGCSIAALSLFWLLVPARAGELTASDANFLKSATENNFGEIALGKLALEKSVRPAIKMFAQMQ